MTETRSPHGALDRPSAWVQRFAPLIPPGEVLDLACGGGRHARLLAALSHRVLAVDRDAQALDSAAGEGIMALCCDLEAEDGNTAELTALFGIDRFSGIVVTNYLHRPLFPRIFASLAPGGVLIYETFAAGNAAFGKPSNPAFLLHTGELLQRAQATSGMRILAFEDGYLAWPKPAMVQRICAVREDSNEGPADASTRFSLG